MPRVTLPTNTRGWLIVLAASMVGFVAGTITLSFLSKRLR